MVAILDFQVAPMFYILFSRRSTIVGENFVHVVKIAHFFTKLPH